MIYAINYDLKKPGRDYSGLYKAIKECGIWWHHLDSTWLLDTSLNAEGIWSRLSDHIDASDRILIINVGKDSQGWLSTDAWEWINSRKSKMAA